jgi:hypothetical protein
VSAPAELRAPASAWQVARHYLGMLGSGGGTLGIALLALVPIKAWSPSVAGEDLLAPMFLLALLHWRGTGRAGGRDDALPLRRSHHDGVRVACGLAWAAAAMLLLAGLSVPFGLATHDLDFLVERALGILPTVPIALGMYAVAAAVRLRSGRPRRALLAVFLLLGLLSAAPPALWVAVAAAAVWLLAPGDLRARVLRARSRRKEPAAPRPTAQRPLAPRGWSGPRTAAGAPRRPARLAAVFGRESRMALRRIALPLAFTAAWAWSRVSGGVDAVGPARGAGAYLSAGFVLVLLCVVPFWVSRVERGAGREHDDSLPVDTATLRALRVAAGAMWLGAVLLAVAAVAAAGAVAIGGAASLPGVLLRTWAGAAGAALLVYLLASVPVFLSARQPYMAGLMYASVWVGVWRYTIDWVPQAAPFLPWSALAPLVDPSAPASAWAPALALWLPLAVLAVPAAAAMGARREHPGWGRGARPARAALGAAAGGAA